MPVAGLAFKTTDPPAQKVVGPAATRPAVGRGFTTTATAAEVSKQEVAVSVTMS